MASLESKMKVEVEMQIRYQWWLILYAILWISGAAFMTGAYLGRWMKEENVERVYVPECPRDV